MRKSRFDQLVDAQKRLAPQKRNATHAYPLFFLRAPVPAENALGTASEPHIASAEHCIGQIITTSPRHSEHEGVEEPKIDALTQKDPRMESNLRCVFDPRRSWTWTTCAVTVNESVFQFHQIVEEAARVIVVRRIERNQLVEVRLR